MSAAADDPRKAAGRVSAVASIGYLAFLVGPPSIGFLGNQVGILHALLLVLLLAAMSGCVAFAARKPHARNWLGWPHAARGDSLLGRPRWHQGRAGEGGIGTLDDHTSTRGSLTPRVP
ncbi:MAG: hypothetical protein WDM88_09765 [Galbitalea sp.]